MLAMVNSRVFAHWGKRMTKDAQDAYKEGRITMERHLQTVIVVLLVGLLGWVGATVQQTQVAVAEVSVEIEYLKKEITKPNERISDLEVRLDRIELSLAELKAKADR